MSWLTNILAKNKAPNSKKGVPDGLWCKCDACDEFLYQSDLAQHLYVCPKCQHHHAISARERLTRFFDADSALVEVGGDALAKDPLKFKDTKKYKDRLQAAVNKAGETEAFIALYGDLFGHKAVAGAFEFTFIGGSMSSAVGERFVQAAEKAIAEQCPFICFCTSGGARMQEGMFSLLQMAKTSAVIAQLQQHKVIYNCINTSYDGRCVSPTRQSRRYHFCRASSTDRLFRSSCY